MYLETANVPGTPESRIKALTAAKPMVSGSSFLSTSGAGAEDLIRLATYIETGHDYRDTHPDGKRRPLQRITNVTVMAPEGELEHLMSHLEDGSFAEFLAGFDFKPDAADPEKSDGRD